MASWVEVEELRDELQFVQDDTSRDVFLQRMIDSACASIERIKGRIGTDTVTGELQTVQRLGIVLLDVSPVQSVQAVSVVTRNGTPRPLNAADPKVGNLGGWELASAGGVLNVPALPGEQVLVDYTVGLAEIPGDWHEAAVELAAFLYDSTQNNAGGGRTGAGAEDDDWPTRAAGGIGAYAMPFRVRELLGLYGSVVRSQVLVR